MAPTIRSTGIDIPKGRSIPPSDADRGVVGRGCAVPSVIPVHGRAGFALHRNGIDAAKAAGIRHIIYTSLSFCGGAEDSTSVAQVAQAHLKTEAYLKESGLTYTIIRYGSYSHLWNNYAGFIDLSVDRDIVQDAVLPNDGQAHRASRDDMGEATGRVIANRDRIREKEQYE